MCGLVVAIGADAAQGARCVRHGMSALAHRGPDGQGIWADHGIALGHVRLALVDVAGGQQPMHCGALRAVVIGEIYDDRRIRKVLEAKGHHFRSMCDSELVLHAYREWGTALFTHLHGGFAFVLVDEERRTCLFARDAMGIRPLLFAEHERRLLIASEAKALFAMGVPARWSERGLDQALGIQYPLPGDTIFAGIQGLRPGEYAEVSLDDPTRPKTRSFFQPKFEVQRAPTAPAELRQTLIAAVERRLRGEGAKCTLLSGGLDSASITAIAAASCRRNGRPPLPAYTVSFVDHRGFDEAARARAIADHLGLDRHLVIEVEDRRLADGFARAVVQGEGLVINGHITAKRDLIARIAEDGHRVVLTGEGADELFLGYAHLRADTGVDSAVLAQSNRASSAWMLPAGDNANGAATGHATWLSAKASVGHIINGFVHHPDARRPERAVVRLLEAISPPVGASPVEVNAHRWAHTALGHYILQTLGDRTEMAFAVEARFPMLDRDVVELSHRIPVTDKIRGQQEKWCLRQAMAPLLPRDVLEREKHPFAAPPGLIWSKGAPTALAEQTLLENPARFIDRDAVRRVVDTTHDANDQAQLAPALTLLASASILEQAYGL